MRQLLTREMLAVGAAVGTLGVVTAGWAVSRSHSAETMPPRTAAATLAPVGGAPAPALEVEAGGPAPTVAPPAPGASPVVATPAPAPTPAALVVHVAGAVKNPGVYRFKPGDRLNDAIKAAGGFKTNADPDALNLADTLRDADQIFVASKEANPAPPASVASGAPVQVAFAAPPTTHKHKGGVVTGTPVVRAAPAAPAVAPAPSADTPAPAPSAPPRGRVIGKPAPAAGDAADDGDNAAPAAPGAPPVVVAGGAGKRAKGGVSKSKGAASKANGKGGGTKWKAPGEGVVHLNSATAAQLEHISGIGPAMSARILQYRGEIGGKFTAVEQIMDVKGIGAKKFAKMQPFLAL